MAFISELCQMGVNLRLHATQPPLQLAPVRFNIIMYF